MRFRSILVIVGIAFSTVAHAVPNPVKTKRALQNFLDVLDGIGNQTRLVTTLVSGYTGGDATPILDAFNDLIDLVNGGTDTIHASTPLNAADGLLLVRPILDVTDDFNQLADALITKEAFFADNGYMDDIIDRVAALKTALEGLADAIISKVSSELADLAAELSAGVVHAIQRVLDEYATLWEKAKRGLQDYLDVIAGINAQVNLVHDLAAAYDGGDPSPVINALNDLVYLIQQGINGIQTFPALTPQESLALVQPIQDLVADFYAMIDVLIEKEIIFINNSYEDDILASLQAVKIACEGFADALAPKFPPELRDLVMRFMLNWLALFNGVLMRTQTEGAELCIGNYR